MFWVFFSLFLEVLVFAQNHIKYLLVIYNPAALFTISGGWIEIIIHLFGITLFWKLTWYFYLMLQSSLCFRRRILETFNFTLYFVTWGSQAVGETSGNAQTSMLKFLRILIVFQILFKVKKMFRNFSQWSVLRLDEWLGAWDGMVRHLEQWTPLVDTYYNASWGQRD